MNKIRKARVESVLKREVATLLLTEVKDPRLGMITVTGISLTHDLKTAHVYVSVMGDAETKKRNLEILTRASSFIRLKVGENVRMQFTPKIVFAIDNALDEKDRVDKLLKEIEDSHKDEQ